MPVRKSKARAVAAAAAAEQPSNGAAPGSGPAGDVPVSMSAAVGPTMTEPPGGESATERTAAAGSRPSQNLSPGRFTAWIQNWRVRARLLTLVVVPTAVALALGGASIHASWLNAVSNQRIERLATLSAQVTNLAYELETERDFTVNYIAGGSKGRAAVLAGHHAAGADLLSLVMQQYSVTNAKIATVKAGLAALGQGYPVAVLRRAQSAALELGTLQSLRNSALHTNLTAINVIDKYAVQIDDLLALNDQVALSSSDPQLASTARAFGQISRIENQYSIQRAIVMYALTAGRYASGMEQMLTGSVQSYNADFDEFTNFATAQQLSQYNSDLAGSLVGLFNSYRQSVIEYGQTYPTFSGIPIVPADWFGAATETIGQVHLFEQVLVASAVDRANLLRRNAIIAAVVVASGVALMLLFSILLTLAIGRSLVSPLRRLRAGALEVAGVRLPETVRRMSESNGENVPAEVEPIDVYSYDEIGEVARAFDQVHREALRLAATEAALRGNVNAMFVNLSRRSQSLVERQIRLIDELEQGEQDPERLASLFQMDHLATRMRRNSENLLVLAGHDWSRRWNQPVPLMDVLRAAISEIEQYERVSLKIQPGICIQGSAVNDVVHLVAELVENATAFSSSETPVVVSGNVLTSGGVLLDITDQGVGMGSEEMAHANWRLDNPPVVDVAVSRRMGLFVVARLAARHGIRVRLRPAEEAGLTALVWLPDEVIFMDDAIGRGSGSVFVHLQTDRMSAGASGLPSDGADWRQEERAGGVDEDTGVRVIGIAASQDDRGRMALGPQRIPGAGLHPGHFGVTATGPLPAIDAAPAKAAADAGPASPGGYMPTAAQYGDGPAGAGAGTEAGTVDEPAAYGASTTPIRVFDTSQPSAWRSRARGGEPPGDETAAGKPESAGPGASRAAGPPSVVVGPAVPGGFRPGSVARVDGSSRHGDGSVWPGEAAGSGARVETGRGSLFESGLSARIQDAGRTGSGPDQSASTPESPDSPDSLTTSSASAIIGAPVTGSIPLSGIFPTQGHSSADGEVIVPPAASLGEENRLPIFEAVESDWFRHGRPAAENLAERGDDEVSQEWASPVDQGWKAAEAAMVPAAGGTTGAGLPRRVPKANLIPGAATESFAQSPVRSPAATRERFASLQRGLREARAAAGEAHDSDDEAKDGGLWDVPREQ